MAGGRVWGVFHPEEHFVALDRRGGALGRRAGLRALAAGAQNRTELLGCADQACFRVGIRGVCSRGGAKARYKFEHGVLSRWGRREPESSRALAEALRRGEWAAAAGIKFSLLV